MNFNISYFQLIIETTLTFFILLIFTRLLGKKQMSHLTFFNYITGITIGSVASNMIMLDTKSYPKEVTALAIWCLLTVLLEFISLKSPKIRLIIDGQPTIIIKKGKILRKSLKKVRLNIDDVSMLLREQKIFSIKDVEYAILEPNGRISILQVVNKQSITKEDLKIITPTPMYIPTEIIIDGKFVDHNLTELNLTKDWVMLQLSKSGINSIDKILYAEIQEDGSIYIDLD